MNRVCGKRGELAQKKAGKFIAKLKNYIPGWMGGWVNG